MQIFAETPRLILRELLPADDKGMFELDSDLEVHRYLGNHPVNHIGQSREIIESIRQQYTDNGIGRWAVIEKDTNNFLGWAGLKLVKEPTNHHTGFHDLGYRLIKTYWGKGFATEAAKASLTYGFGTLNLDVIYGMADINNHASRHVLEKAGLRFIETFDLNGITHSWLTIHKEEWLQLH